MLDIQFSPDGKNLIFHVSIADVQYLVKAALRLSPAELHTVGAEIKKPDPDVRSERETSGEKVALKDFEALKGGPGRPWQRRISAAGSWIP